MPRRRLVIPLVAVGCVAIVGVGAAIAGLPGLSSASSSKKGGGTTPTSSSRPSQARPLEPDADAASVLDAAARALHLTVDQLRQKLSDGKTTIADVAKQEHIDLNTVIDAVLAGDRQRIQDVLNAPFSQLTTGAGTNAAPGGSEAGGKGSTPAPITPELDLASLNDSAAKALGISLPVLAQHLEKGQSIAEIANTKHVDLGKVIDAMVAEGSARIDQLQRAGKLTRQQANEQKASLRQRVTAFVNGSRGNPTP